MPLRMVIAEVLPDGRIEVIERAAARRGWDKTLFAADAWERPACAWPWRYSATFASC